MHLAEALKAFDQSLNQIQTAQKTLGFEEGTVWIEWDYVGNPRRVLIATPPGLVVYTKDQEEWSGRIRSWDAVKPAIQWTVSTGPEPAVRPAIELSLGASDKFAASDIGGDYSAMLAAFAKALIHNS